MNTVVVNTGTAFAPQLASADTIYVLSGAYNLGGSPATVPTGSVLKFLENATVTNGILQFSSGCTLRFEEGSKITNCLLVLNNTLFEGTKHRISTTVSGTQYELDTDYFDLTGTNKKSIMQSIIDVATCVQLHGRFVDVFNNITIVNGSETAQNHIEKPKIINGNGATIVNTFTDSTIAAIKIKTDDLVRITDINFEINAGYAIYKDTNVRQENTRLSFIFDRCRFRRTAASNSGLIRLINSREGNITNCIFLSDVVYGGLGIDRSNAINTNVIGCMFSKFNYGIYAKGVHTTDDPNNDYYTSFACGLNVQSAVMLGCKYGIYIEGNDSFFLNNSMIDYCVYPLVIVSQDGANITNNYFSARRPEDVDKNVCPVYDHTAIITIKNKPSIAASEENKRIILFGNTIYGHRNNACHGIDMDIESIDCTIQNNTFDFFREYGIQLRNTVSTYPNWSTEKLVIDNNRFHFVLANIDYGNGLESNNAYPNIDAIHGEGCIGDVSVIISNNYAINVEETIDNNLIQSKFITAGNAYFGDCLSFGNHDYLVHDPSGTAGSEIKSAFKRNSTRIKINLSMSESSPQLTIDNPMHSADVVVYIANNTCPIFVDYIDDSDITFGKNTNLAASFVAIIERKYEL